MAIEYLETRQQKMPRTTSSVAPPDEALRAALLGVGASISAHRQAGKGKAVLSKSTATKPGPAQASNRNDSTFLFRLPPEIRNLIFELALSGEPQPLRLCGDFTPQESFAFVPHQPKLYVVRTNGIHEEYNQLKYACRRLWTETAGVEAKFNKVLITKADCTKYSAIPSFILFAQSCAPKKIEWFRHVIIKTTCEEDEFLPESSGLVYKLAKFCRQHPRMHIDYMLPGFGNGPIFPTSHWQLISVGTLYKWAFCDVDLRPLAPDILPYNDDWPLDAIIEDAKIWRGVWTWRDLSARNLVFLPVDDGRVDESILPDYVEDKLRRRWIKFARLWARAGFQAKLLEAPLKETEDR